MGGPELESTQTASDHWLVFRRFALLVLVPAAIVMVGILAVAKLQDVPVSDLLRDASAVLDGEFYVGMFSTTGIALWAASAAICLLILASSPESSAVPLLVAGAVVSLVLGADDAYLIHETMKNYVGVSSYITIAIYGVAGIVLFWRARQYLMSTPNLSVFASAIVLLGISLALDFAGEAGLWTPPLAAVIEDVAKFLGIVSWLAFFAGVGRRLILNRGRDPEQVHHLDEI